MTIFLTGSGKAAVVQYWNYMIPKVCFFLFPVFRFWLVPQPYKYPECALVFFTDYFGANRKIFLYLTGFPLFGGQKTTKGSVPL